MQTDAKPPTSPLAKGIIAGLVLAILVLGTIYLTRILGHERDAQPEVVPAKAKAEKREPVGPTFLNARPDVEYTGVASCARCHEARYTSYKETSHSRSLSDLDPAKEHLPGSYHHEASDLYYRMYEQDGAMRIEESVRLEAGDAHVLADHPVKYLIGSGNHSRSYLVEIDGFLHEAPVTWYASKQAYSISPGYNRTMHMGFLRPVGVGCISCHVGRAEALDGSINKMRLHEEAIGCERCHGAGKLHEDLRRRPEPVPEGDDLTIVDPKIMTREQKMSLCAQCHQDDTLTIPNPRHRNTDWRPGMPWNDVHVTYRLTDLPKDMTVTGHVDQLRLSACFQGSDTMTCLTCHNPHAEPPAEEQARRDHFNGKCLTCHEHCGRKPDEGEGIVPAAGDDCIRCHMPRGDTDIAHIAFTHHRIGIHGEPSEPPAPTGPLPVLEPLGDVSHLDEAVQQRSLGLAYLQLMRTHRWPQPVFMGIGAKAAETLAAARAAGLREPELEAALARIRGSERKYDEAEELATSALKLDDTGGGLRTDQRAGCMGLLASLKMRSRDFEGARKAYEKLRGIRRDSADCVALLDVMLLTGDKTGAVEAARRALSVWPNSAEVHYQAAQAFDRAGEKDLAELHNRIGEHIHKQQSKGAALATD